MDSTEPDPYISIAPVQFTMVVAEYSTRVQAINHHNSWNVLVCSGEKQI